MFNYTLDFGALGLQPPDILKEIGYGEVMPEDEIVTTTGSLLAEVASFVKPSCTFGLFDGAVTGTSVMLGEHILATGNTIAGLLKGSEHFCLFAATAGTLFQEFQDKTKEKEDILRTFILDMIGSCIAEKTGDIMEKLLEKEIAGYRHTHRFSPGYCGWLLTEQKQLFRLLGGNPSGITLSESYLMTPVKSISGIIGIGKEVNEKQYGCHFCELETCYKKKIK
jgi:hypothetical protein